MDKTQKTLGALVGAACALALGLGCSKTFRETVVQPNPMAHPEETLPISEKVVIITGDMELRMPRSPEASQRVALWKSDRYPLINEAQFVAVSRDRLRFHVQVEHKWPDWADLRGWDVELVDDRGRSFSPEALEHPKTKFLTQMWDFEQRSTIRNSYGDIVAINEDGWKNRQPFGSLSVYRGTGDFVFYQDNLFTKEVKGLRLIISRQGQRFEFGWSFTDGEAGFDGGGHLSQRPSASRPGPLALR